MAEEQSIPRFAEGELFFAYAPWWGQKYQSIPIPINTREIAKLLKVWFWTNLMSHLTTTNATTAETAVPSSRSAQLSCVTPGWA